MKPIKEIIGAEKNIQQKYLHHDVYKIEKFYENVETRHVGAPAFPYTKARYIGDLGKSSFSA